MKQNPKIFKYSRVFRKKLKNVHDKNNNQLFLSVFNYGFKAMECGKLNYNHLKMIDLLFRRKKVKNQNYFYKINFGMITPVTAKPIETRMGKGKGLCKFWEYPVYSGTILIEVFCSDLNLLTIIFLLIKDRLPIKIKLVKLMY